MLRRGYRAERIPTGRAGPSVVDFNVTQGPRKVLAGRVGVWRYGSADRCQAFGEHWPCQTCIAGEMTGGVTFWHLLFDQHEIVTSNGLPTESFRPGPVAMRGLDQAVAIELCKFFPGVDLRTAGLSSVRYLATHDEAKLIFDRL